MPENLPTCQCVAGRPVNGKLDAIYCALLQLGGGGGGEITLSQISDLDASWIPPLQDTITPIGVSILTDDFSGGPDYLFGINGTTGALVTLEFTDFGSSVLALTPTPETFVVVSAGGMAISGPANPITITASQISDTGALGVAIMQMTTFPTVAPAGIVAFTDGTVDILERNTVTQTPVTSITTLGPFIDTIS